MPALNTDGRSGLSERDPAEVELANESDEMLKPQKSKVECICPMCSQKHTMNIIWIGRGSPRKYCQNCRGSF